jgi:hypothetical protein
MTTTKDRTVFDELKARGEEFFTRMSGELMSNPNFTRAMQAAWWTKEKFDQGVAQALKGMRIPSRDEFKRVVRRVEDLEAELERVKAAQKSAARPAARAAARSAPARRARKPRASGGGTGPAED